MKTKKLLFLLVYFIGILNTIQLYAQNELPYMPLKDNFGGSTVNLSTFVPSPGDFTLDVQGNANTAININFAGITYTPTTTGTIRFVRYQNKVYVFEKGKFTVVTPVTPNQQYTKVGNNLIQNGSFETATLFTGSTNRWQPSVWETWDGGASTWGDQTGDTSVREDSAFRSDGLKSLIMHSRARHLMQELATGSLQANSYYLLTYDYWTSSGSGNGGSTYKVNLGTERLFADVQTFTAHTTDETGTAKKSFSLIFQAPANVPPTLWFDFYRDATKVDWLDNIQMVQIVPSNTGIIGATSATYIQGKVYAPENLALSSGDFVNMTSKIINPDFNNDLSDWNVVTGSKISTSEKAGGLIPGTQKHVQIWVASGGVNGRFYQKISNLPNGKYALRVAVAPSFSGTVDLFANNGTTSIVSGNSKYYEVIGVVFDGSLDIGLKLTTSGSPLIDFDSFTLKYLGIDVEAYLQVLEAKKQLALADISSMQNSPGLPGYNNLAQYNSALFNANNLPDNTASTLVDAISQIDLAINEYDAILAAYEPLKIAIGKLTSALSASTYPNKNEFENAISAAQELYNSKQDQRTNINSSIVNLEAKSTILKVYNDLAGLIATVNKMINETDYQGKSVFQSAVGVAQGVYDQPVGKNLADAIATLQAARTAYYNSQYTLPALQETVSWVDTSLNGSEKIVLRVDGKPWYMNSIQVRLDKLKGTLNPHFDAAALESVVEKAAKDGFNTIQIPIQWVEVEPEKNKFDWTVIDEYMGYCKKYGLKLELLWYSWSSGGRIQYLLNNELGVKLRTPDYVCSLQGTSDFTIRRTTDPWTLDWYDNNLLDRETYVVRQIFEHIAVWDANNGHPHTVIGVQLGNEPHGWEQTVSNSRIIDYYSKVGSAIKESKYVVWTRLNNISWETSGRVSANETKRNNGGTNIDFVGTDIYGTSAWNMRYNEYSLINGKNYPMIMESDAKVSGAPFYQIAALAGNKAYSHYNYAIVDGNSLYSQGSGFTLVERSHTNDVRIMNKTLNLDIADIALKKQGNSLYVYNYDGTSTAVENGIEGISFTPSEAKSCGISIRRSNSEIILMSTKGGIFNFPESLDVGSVSKGHVDFNNNWISEGDVSVTASSVTVPGITAVRLKLNVAKEISGIIKNPSFEEGSYQNGDGYTVPKNWKLDSRLLNADVQLKNFSALDGTYRYFVWTEAGGSVDFYQDIVLPAGKYTVKSGLKANDPNTTFLYVQVNGTKIQEPATGGSWTSWINVPVKFEVPEGNTPVRIGVSSTSAVMIDNFQLFQKIDDLAYLKSIFKEEKILAETNVALTNFSGFYNLLELEAALTNANKIDLATVDQTSLQTAYDMLKAANVKAADIIAAYQPLKKAIENALLYAESTNYPGKSVFEGAIDVAEGVYKSTTDQRSNIVSTIANLDTAMLAYKSTRPSEWLTIKNGALWKDEDGNPVQAHGAGFLQVGDKWYMIGEDRSDQWHPDVNMYSSTDLIHWKFENKIIKNGSTHPELGTSRFIERPKLLRCPKTGQFVVWCHWESGNYGASEVAVFYSDTINGDYKFHWAGRPLGVKSRDCNVFVDNDGTAYFISTTSENTDLGLFRLSDDYLSAVEHTVLFPKGYREAPAIVRLGDTYFMISSALTGWDPNQGKISYSKSLTSGWSGLANVGNGITFDTQAASILTIQGSKETSYLYVGDRWQDPGLPESKTIIFPISFSGNNCIFKYSQQFDIDFSTGKLRETSVDNRIPKTAWKVRAVSSEETSSENASASNAIDGNTATIWHTKYSGTAGIAPHSIEIDMGAEYEVSGFVAAPRLDNSTNGLIRNFQFYTSIDGKSWKPVAGGNWLPYYAEVYFPTTNARYFRLVAPSGTYATLSEISMLKKAPVADEVVFKPYYQIDGGTWETSNMIKIEKGSTVKIGPQPSNGSWSWYGPNGFVANQREFTIANIDYVNSGIYTGLFLDRYNHVHKFEINVEVNRAPESPKDLSIKLEENAVLLNWPIAERANSYTVKKASSWEGPYETIAEGVTTNDYKDNYEKGDKYFYVVSAVNEKGESGNSKRVSTLLDKFVYLKFDEGSDIFARDSWSGLDGTLTNSASWEEGKAKNSVYLNGSENSNVVLPEGMMAEITDFTISTWVKLDENTNWNRVFDFGSGADKYMFLTPKSALNTLCYTIKKGTTEEQITSNLILPVDGWHHISVTQSGSLGILYVDGVEAGRNENMSLNPSSLGVTTQNWIGKSQVTNQMFNGNIDEFKIYNRALSSVEIIDAMLLPPNALAKNVTVQLNAEGVAILTTEQVDAGSVSYRGELSLSLDKTSFDCSNVGTPIKVILTATDEGEYCTTVNATVDIVDNLKPVVKVPEELIFCYNENGVYNLPELIATDNCGLDKIAYVVSGNTIRQGTGVNPGNSFNVGQSIITWTVTDSSGNQSTATTIVVVNQQLAVAINDKYVLEPHSAVNVNTIYYGYKSAETLIVKANASGGSGSYSYLWNTGEITESITVTKEGTYTVTVTDTKGCIVSSEINVKSENVSCGNNGDKVMVCFKGKMVCISSSAVPSLLKNGGRLGSCNSNTVENEPGYFNVYPNPATNYFIVKTSEKLEPNAILRIYNSTNYLVLTQKLNSDNQVIDIANFPQGFYIVQLTNGNIVSNQKLLKE